MKIQIGMMPDKKNIACIKEYAPIDSKEEIAHFLAEISLNLVQKKSPSFREWDEFCL